MNVIEALWDKSHFLLLQECGDLDKIKLCYST
jgi:hypothetical protein